MPHRQWMAGFLALNVLVQKHNFNTDADVELTAEFIWDNSNRNVTIKLRDAGPVMTGWVCKNATDLSVLCMQVSARRSAGRAAPTATNTARACCIVLHQCRPTHTTHVLPSPRALAAPVASLQVYQVMLPTQTAEYKVPDGLTEVKLVASSRINDGANKRSMQARMSSWVVINNAGNVPFPRGLGKELSMKQIAVMGFPWVSALWQAPPPAPLPPLSLARQPALTHLTTLRPHCRRLTRTRFSGVTSRSRP